MSCVQCIDILSHNILIHLICSYALLYLSNEWNQAEKLMSNYKSVLTRRDGLKSEVAIMEEKNLKLEQELESKLKEKINEDLAFPPTKILSVGGDKDDSEK